jgi:hypothetical protein
MHDLAELTPSRVLLLFNAWEHPGAYPLQFDSQPPCQPMTEDLSARVTGAHIA